MANSLLSIFFSIKFSLFALQEVSSLKSGIIYAILSIKAADEHLFYAEY